MCYIVLYYCSLILSDHKPCPAYISAQIIEKCEQSNAEGHMIRITINRRSLLCTLCSDNSAMHSGWAVFDSSGFMNDLCLLLKDLGFDNWRNRQNLIKNISSRAGAPLRNLFDFIEKHKTRGNTEYCLRVTESERSTSNTLRWIIASDGEDEAELQS